MKPRTKLFGLLLAAVASTLIFSSCGKKPEAGNAASPSAPAASPSASPSETPSGIDPTAKHPVVTIEMDNGKTIKAELYPEVAPNTVNNFISLVKKGFYDGTIFHRVIPGFMIQGGDPEGTGMGGPGYSIPGEFAANGFTNNLKHTRGILSMARAQDPDSAGSQFFLMVADAPHLDGQYAAFGQVIEGMNVADDIVNLERDASDRPTKPPVMKKVTVDTLGEEYPEPKHTEDQQ